MNNREVFDPERESAIFPSSYLIIYKTFVFIQELEFEI